ncbi:MAG: hypothetical protein ABWY50_01435 [Aeromicrobium sp.]
MLTRARAAALVLAGLPLAACSTVHPGSAAVVDGETISMQTLDSTAEAYCTLTADAAQQQGVTTLSNGQVRRQAVVGLVSVVVARSLAEREGIEIPRRAYELTASQRDQIAAEFPGADVDELGRAIEDSQEVSAIAVALAAQETGEQPSEENESQLAELGQSTILQAFPGHDVKFAPRFGLAPTGEPRAETGSISVTPPDLEAPTDQELPVAQRCS